MLVVVLLAVLLVPTLIWVAVRYRPDAGRTKVTKSGLKHRWWQP